MKKYLLILLTFIGIAILTFVNGVPFIFGDGYGYYHIGKNIVSEKNFVSNEKPDYYEYTGHAVSLEDGKYVTTYPPGNAILWLPFLAVSNAIETGSINTDYYKAFNGHSIYDGIAILFAAAFYTFLSIILVYKILRKLTFSERNAIYSVALVYISTYALSYFMQFASYSHVYEIFTCAATLYFIIKFGEKFEYKWMTLAGIFAGLLFLTRPFDLLVIAPIALYVFIYRNGRARGNFITGFMPIAVIYPIYNWISYGNPFKTGYGNSSQMFDFTTFNLDKLLLSEVRGWFVYSPLMFLALVGLFLYTRRNKPSILLYLLPVVLTILGYCFWPNWWGGDSLGQRFFLVLLPFMAIGMSYLIKLISQKLSAHSIEARFENFVFNYFKVLVFILISILGLYSLIVMIFYRITPTAELYKSNEYLAPRYSEVTLAERFSPFDILNYHLTLSNEPDYTSKVIQSLNGGRSLMLLALGQTDPLAKIEPINDREFILNLIPNNVNKPVNTDLEIGIERSDKYIHFQFTNLDLSSQKAIKFNCIEDSNCSAEGAPYERTILSSRSNTNPQSTYSDQLKVDLKANAEINFIDFKLKN